MPEPKTRHYWMPDGRSLCDRRAFPINASSQEPSDDYLVCGCCLLVMYEIRETLMLSAEAASGIWPSTSEEAAHGLRNTRWDDPNLDAYAEAAKVLDLRTVGSFGFAEDAIQDALAKRRQGRTTDGLRR